MSTDAKIAWQRMPIIIRFAETAKFTETYGFAGSQGMVALEGQHFLPELLSETVYIFMHPASTL